MRRDLELSLFFIRALDGPDVPVVGRKIVCRAQGERRFQICFLRFPVNRITEFNSVAGIAGR